ncbi:hypothetical protein LZK82_17115 [Rhizobium leguminosarum]|nr:hypothetical protein LZK82_17115 [Rhizobium leguminosarum]UIK09725.1 hypothetical protein LZK80_17265 [Rhizobium leguminosarum]
MTKFEPGAEVRLVRGTTLWGQHHELRDATGLVVALVDDGTTMDRITVSYGDEIKFRGIDANLFEPEQEIRWYSPTGENLWRGMIGETEVAHVWAQVDELDRLLAWHWRITHTGVKDGIPATGNTNLDEAHAKESARLAYLAGPRVVGNG